MSYCLARVLTRRSFTSVVEDQMDKMLRVVGGDPLAKPLFSSGRPPPFDPAMQAKLAALRTARDTQMKRAQTNRNKLRAKTPPPSYAPEVAYLGELRHDRYQEFLRYVPDDPVASKRLLIPTDVPCHGGPNMSAYWEYTQ